jgi:spore coat protein U-like protein
MSLRTFAFVIFAFLMQAIAASAQVCTFSNTGVDFGNLNLTTGSTQSSTGAFTASCTGTPGQTVNICANFNAGSGGVATSGDPRYMLQGTTKLNYNIFTNNGVGQVWGSYLWAPSPRPPNLSIKLSNIGSGSVSQTMFGRIYNAQTTTPTGTFISTFSGSQSQIDYGYSASFNCSSTLSPRVQSVPFVVRTTNNSTCAVTTTNLDFGAQTSLASAMLATNSIYITCTPGTAYTIGMSNGTSGATSPALRKMTNATTTDFVGYGIYLDAARTQVWGNGVTGAMPSTTGNGLAQSFTGYGLVPAQATPTPLDYTDTVIVTITY